MEKVNITGFFLKTAYEFVKLAHVARVEGLIEKEIRVSITVHLLSGISLESAINEIAQNSLPAQEFEKLEKADTYTKWSTIPKLLGAPDFAKGVDPLQSVQELKKTRNLIAHPKQWESGVDLMIRHTDGILEHNVPLDRKLQNGDMLYLGFGKIRNEFNAHSAQRSADRAHEAILKLRDAVDYKGFIWLSDLSLEM